MTKGNVLIVEDELLIASTIESCVEEHGFTTAGTAVSYDEAILILETQKIDIVLLDINLFGDKSGIDLANTINLKYQIPFIYLTSYADSTTINELQTTSPKGYLSKPINEVDLTTMLSIVLNNAAKDITLFFGKKKYILNVEKLLYVNTDHVYLELFYNDKKELVRSSISAFLEQLPPKTLVQINRSCAINPKKIFQRIGKTIYLENNIELKISDKFFYQFI